MIKVFNKVGSFTLTTSQKKWVLPTGVSEWTGSDWSWFSVAKKDIALALKTKRVEILKDKSASVSEIKPVSVDKKGKKDDGK